jgi:hypothetical protein
MAKPAPNLRSMSPCRRARTSSRGPVGLSRSATAERKASLRKIYLSGAPESLWAVLMRTTKGLARCVQAMHPMHPAEQTARLLA